MSCSLIFITDLNGRVIISRKYRNDLKKNIFDIFKNMIIEGKEKKCPIFQTCFGFTLIFIKHNDLFFVSAVKSALNSNIMMMICFLYQLVKVFEEYFGSVEINSIRDNFIIIYELLDEMIDNGFPQVTNAKMLKEYIFIDSQNKIDKINTNSLTRQITSYINWRREGIIHKKNEIFLDVIEKLNLLISKDGNILHSEIFGVLKLKSFLSGMPELKLGLNDRIQLENKKKYENKMIEMSDIRFHQCVRLKKFYDERIISFIPPDGEFELMNYRLCTKIKKLIWVECYENFRSRYRVKYCINAKSQFKNTTIANDVTICIPIPRDADNPKCETNHGKIKYYPELYEIHWNIKQFKGEERKTMQIDFGISSITIKEGNNNKLPIKIHFEIPYFTVSGIQVRYLKIVDSSGYKALPWVRYSTQNGDYQIRQ